MRGDTMSKSEGGSSDGSEDSGGTGDETGILGEKIYINIFIIYI